MVSRLLRKPSFYPLDQWLAFKPCIRVVLHGVAWYRAEDVQKLKIYVPYAKVHGMSISTLRLCLRYTT